MAEDPLKRLSLRCFLAIPLGELFREELALILEPLQRRVSGVRWVDSKQVHLTLHFFGSISAADLERINLAMRGVTVFPESVWVTLDRIGGFPSLERPNILWLGVSEKTGKLLSLQKAIRDVVEGLGFEVESRPFHPHATIGRVENRSGEGKTLAAMTCFRFPTAGKIIDHFVLYQSRCLPQGARYEILKTYPISKKT